MNKILIGSFLMISLFSHSQTHSIDDLIINFSDDASVDNFYANTYYNAYEYVDITWQIIESDIPEEWSFSVCFPNCYKRGVTFGSNSFTPNSQQYLNCHFYPNNTTGTGILKMEITTNNEFTDTVTWIGIANSISVIPEFFQNKINDTNVKIYDSLGKKLSKLTPNMINIIVYPNGKVEKYFYTEE